MRRFLVVSAVATLVAVVTPSLQAQGRGNQSDVSGTKPGNGNNGTGSNGKGTGANNGNNGPAGTPGNPNKFVFGEALTLGAAPAAAPGVTVLSLVPIAQRAGATAARLVADVGVDSKSSSALVDALIRADGAPSAAQVERFASRYAGMLNDPSPKRIASAASAFNEMVNGASVSYLSKPPAEFVAAQAVLTEMVARTSQR